MEELTARQQEILAFIKDVQAHQHAPPTLREIAKHFGFKSPNAAQAHVRALRNKGYLEHAPHKARSLQAIDPLSRMRGTLLDIPLFGSVPAGFATAELQATAEESTGCISVDASTLNIKPTARTFALQVRGDSMIGRHICDGDFVICEHGLTPRQGDIVAALIDNESTLKTFVREKSRPFLKAENPKYPELIPATELVIQGVVVGLVRRFD